MSLLSMLGFGRSVRKTKIDQISATDAYERILTGQTTLIDVRRSVEWNDTGRPMGSHGITLQDTDFLQQVLHVMEHDKSGPIAFACRSGARSSEAAKRAEAAGHTTLTTIDGGFLAWVKAGLPIDKGPF